MTSNKEKNADTLRKTPNDELVRLSIKEFGQVSKKPIVLVLDNLRSMHNVGSAFRTADAFLVEKIVLCGITATPPHREIHKTALGATDTVEWVYEAETSTALQKLKENGWKIILIEQIDQSITLQDFSYLPEEKYAFVFGNEVFGISEEILELADACLEIPQFGSKHSLNVSVSMGVILWDYFLKTNA